MLPELFGYCQQLLYQPPAGLTLGQGAGRAHALQNGGLVWLEIGIGGKLQQGLLQQRYESLQSPFQAPEPAVEGGHILGTIGDTR